MKACIVIAMQKPHGSTSAVQCSDAAARCSGGLHAISESRPRQGHGQRSPPSLRRDDRRPFTTPDNVHSIRALIIEIATDRLDATEGSVSCRRQSLYKLLARIITGILPGSSQRDLEVITLTCFWIGFRRNNRYITLDVRGEVVRRGRGSNHGYCLQPSWEKLIFRGR